LAGRGIVKLSIHGFEGGLAPKLLTRD